MKNSNSALIVSHRAHRLCSNCDWLHKTFHGSLKSLVPYTEAASSDNKIPTDLLFKIVHQHISAHFVSRIWLGVPPTISLHALEGPLSSSTLRLQGVIYGHIVVVSRDGPDEGLAPPTADNWVLHAVRSPWWLELKGREAPGHWAKSSENNAMANLLKSNESLRRFRASQFDRVKVRLKGEDDVVSINMVVLKAGAPSSTNFIMKLQFSEAESSFDGWVPVARNMAIEFKQKVPVCAKWAKSTRTLSKSINPHLHIEGLQIRESPETGHAFDDTSWEILGVVANALGNVNARFFSIDHKQRVYKQIAITGSLLIALVAGVGINPCPPQT